MDAASNTHVLLWKKVFPIVHLSSESVRCCGQQTLRHLFPPLLTALTWILDFEFLRIFVVAILDVCCGPSSNLSFMAISVSGRGKFWRQGFPLTSRWSAARMGWVGSLSPQLGLRNPNLKVCPFLTFRNKTGYQPRRFISSSRSVQIFWCTFSMVKVLHEGITSFIGRRACNMSWNVDTPKYYSMLQWLLFWQLGNCRMSMFWQHNRDICQEFWKPVRNSYFPVKISGYEIYPDMIRPIFIPCSLVNTCY